MGIEIWPDSWARILLPHAPLAELVVRASVVYFFLLALLRTLGRREMGRLSIADLLVMVLLAVSVRQALVGTESIGVGDGLIIASLLMFWDWAIRTLVVRFPRLRRLVRPRPVQLVRNGQLLVDQMRAQGLARDQIEAQLRLSGIESIDEVKSAWLESEGQISAIPYEHERRSPPPAAQKQKKSAAKERDVDHG
ncbi:MAG TPA: YetF domain-containing protein [Longimicrobiaceae bacterium]|nr:YetF domain-containing protein [Longimicrobiaceae bacterium]